MGQQDDDLMDAIKVLALDVRPNLQEIATNLAFSESILGLCLLTDAKRAIFFADFVGVRQRRTEDEDQILSDRYILPREMSFVRELTQGTNELVLYRHNHAPGLPAEVANPLEFLFRGRRIPDPVRILRHWLRHKMSFLYLIAKNQQVQPDAWYPLTRTAFWLSHLLRQDLGMLQALRPTWTSAIDRLRDCLPDGLPEREARLQKIVEVGVELRKLVDDVVSSSTIEVGCDAQGYRCFFAFHHRDGSRIPLFNIVLHRPHLFAGEVGLMQINGVGRKACRHAQTLAYLVLCKGLRALLTKGKQAQFPYYVQLKDIAGFCGPDTYSNQGLHRQMNDMRKDLGTRPEHYVYADSLSLTSDVETEARKRLLKNAREFGRKRIMRADTWLCNKVGVAVAKVTPGRKFRCFEEDSVAPFSKTVKGVVLRSRVQFTTQLEEKLRVGVKGRWPVSSLWYLLDDSREWLKE